MAIGGACYLVNSLAFFLVPGVHVRIFPVVLVPCFIAEAALALWLASADVKLPCAQAATNELVVAP